MEIEEVFTFEQLKALHLDKLGLAYSCPTKENMELATYLGSAVESYREHWCSRCGYSSHEHNHDFL